MRPNTVATDRLWVLLAIMALLATWIFTIGSWLRAGTAAEAFTERNLEGAQQLLRVRLTGLVHELEQELRQEAADLDELGNGPFSIDLIRRWRPMLNRHWSLSMVALADEQGNEVALFRSDDGLRLRETTAGSKNDLATISQVPRRRRSSGVFTQVDTVRYDPRTQLWFGKALEDVRDEPTWSLMMNEDGATSQLQVSLLLRDSLGTAPFRILMFQVDPTRSSWLDTRSLPTDRVGMLLLDSDGLVLDRPPVTTNATLDSVVRAIPAEWAAGKHRSVFSMPSLEGTFKALVAPYALHGQTIHTAVVMDLSTELPFIQRERRTLAFLSLLLGLLTLVLGRLWYQRRMVDAEARRQERRRRSQELRLAKALGEREVLNREVHHRVKNNLQVMTSLLNLQAAVLEDGPVRDEFLRGKQRVDTISLVHHKLYALKDLRNVDLDLFLRALAEAVAGLHPHLTLTVSCEVDTQGLRCDQDTAIGLGIIFCELMTNAYRHAFPYATGGHIEVTVRNVEGDLHRLMVKDNGIGLPESGPAGPGRLGLEIVEALADQLDGSFHMRSNGGTTFEVLFRMRPEENGNDLPPEPDSVDEPAAGL